MNRIVDEGERHENDYKNGQTVTSDGEHADNAKQTSQEYVENEGQRVVDRVHVTRDSIDNSATRRHLKELQRRLNIIENKNLIYL